MKKENWTSMDEMIEEMIVLQNLVFVLFIEEW